MRCPTPRTIPRRPRRAREWRDFAHEKVEEFAGTLEGKELEIFRSRLLSEDPPTLQEVGDRFGISRERVRQIESRLKRRLKEFLKLGAGDIESAHYRSEVVGPTVGDPSWRPMKTRGCASGSPGGRADILSPRPVS